MIKPLVSIIVPIYKVEPYLRRCLDSIVNQTYTNLEIILVDDGSPDNSPQICDEYATKDNRIVVIHKENGGLSDARNAGLDICKGEYISFVDSDDWIANTYIELLLKAAIETNTEIAIGNFIKTEQSYRLNIDNIKNPNYVFLNSTSAIKKLWSNDKIIYVTAWGKLIKKTIFTDIRFPKSFIYEDEYTSYKLLYRANKILFLDIPLYCYFQRKDSIIGKSKPNSVRALKAYVERYNFFKEHHETEIAKQCLSTLCWDLLYAYALQKQGKRIQGFKDSKAIINLFKKYQKDYCAMSFPILSKILLSLFSVIPISYIIYQNFSPIKIRKI